MTLSNKYVADLFCRLVVINPGPNINPFLIYLSFFSSVLYLPLLLVLVVVVVSNLTLPRSREDAHRPQSPMWATELPHRAGNSATPTRESHRSSTTKSVGTLVQLNRWGVSCVAALHSGQVSVRCVSGSIQIR